jgi:signal transduction histidine kinase
MTGICMAVTRRKEAEFARLADAHEANELKDQFLATLSHELRTPLNAIIGWIQMLERDAASPDRVRHAIDIIRRNAKLQAQLIEDILDVSRIISGKLTIERQALDVGMLVETTLSGLLPTAALKQIEVTRELADDLPLIEGDPQRLQQVLGNVIANAIKFTPDQGTVSVRCAVSAARRDDTAVSGSAWPSPVTSSNFTAATSPPSVTATVEARRSAFACRLSAA